MRLVIFCDNHQAAGVLVNPVDDARAHDVADPRQGSTAVMDEGVDQGPAQVPRCRMDNKAGGLIDDDEVIILIDNNKRNVLSLRRRSFGRGHGDGRFKTWFDPAGRVDYRLAAQGHLTLFNKPLDARAAEVGKGFGKSAVKAQAVGRLIHYHLARFKLLGHALAMTDLNSPEKPKLPQGSNVPLPLKLAVYAMGVALVVMFAMIGNRFLDRRAENKTSALVESTPWIIEIEQRSASGAVKSAVLDGRYLTVIIETTDGRDQVILIDTRKGQVVGKVRLGGT